MHQLEVLPNKVKLKRAGKTRYKEDYSPMMQARAAGVRRVGGGGWAGAGAAVTRAAPRGACLTSPTPT